MGKHKRTAVKPESSSKLTDAVIPGSDVAETVTPESKYSDGDSAAETVTPEDNCPEYEGDDNNVETPNPEETVELSGSAEMKQTETKTPEQKTQVAVKNETHSAAWVELKKRLDHYVEICKYPTTNIQQLDGRMRMSYDIMIFVYRNPSEEVCELLFNVMCSNEATVYSDQNMLVRANELNVSDRRRFTMFYTIFRALVDYKKSNIRFGLDMEVVRKMLMNDQLYTSVAALKNKYVGE